ncbi:MAG: heme-binding protein [SAR202 cluster bacterium]|jgi:uncharacterized protein GlcG (DUF336 family)|nr:heme-binding protein [SAR202 cluster bacterium]MDP6715601.1 heme-binding protein [SAR202 cluster bacterium]
MSSLTLTEAHEIISTGLAKAEATGVLIAISVVDPRGDLIAMARMDGAPWRTPAISRGKAIASACFGRSSGEMTDGSQSPVMRAVMAQLDGDFIPGQGALPVFRDGVLVGAAGGSGAASQEDEDAVRAGIEAAGLSATA